MQGNHLRSVNVRSRSQQSEMSSADDQAFLDQLQDDKHRLRSEVQSLLLLNTSSFQTHILPGSYALSTESSPDCCQLQVASLHTSVGSRDQSSDLLESNSSSRTSSPTREGSTLQAQNRRLMEANSRLSRELSAKAQLRAGETSVC